MPQKSVSFIFILFHCTFNSFPVIDYDCSVAEWSARRTRNPTVPGQTHALATCWICSRSSRVEILGHAYKQPTGCFLPVGVLNPVMLYLNYFVCRSNGQKQDGLLPKGHSRVAQSLCFKARLSARLMQIKLIFTRTFLYLASF